MERTQGTHGAWQGGRSAGDDAAFTGSFTRLAPRLYDFLARLSGRPDAADALLRQTASQAAMGASSAAQWPSERSWLFSRAFTVLPNDGGAGGANPAPFLDLDPARLPALGDDEAVDAVSRAVWRAVSALPQDQHALLHLRVREAMVPGDAASVLGITEREANERLARLTASVEETARDLFLLRHGRARDAALDDLLEGRDSTHLTPELRSFLDDYLRATPSARAMLTAVPPPLAVYAALRPVAIPPAAAAAAAAAALPWLAAAGRGATVAAPRGADEPTGMLPEQEATTTFAPDAPTTMNPNAPNAPYANAPGDLTGMTPTVSGGYGQGYGQGQGQGQGAAPGYGAPPSDATSGTQMLNIPVRQRVLPERAAVVMPSRPPRRGPPPVAIIGGLVAALVLIVGALVLFLSGGGGGAIARATATIGGTVAASGTPDASAVPDVLLTSTAIAANRVLTVTAQAGSPTPIPTATSPPQPAIRLPSATDAAGSAVASGVPTPAATATATAAAIPTQEPRVTPVPTFTVPTAVAPIPRTTLAPPAMPQATVPVPTFAPRPTTPPTAAAAATPRPSVAATAATTTAATAARTVVSTAASTAAPTTARTAAATAAATMPVAATPAAATPTTAPAVTATRPPAATMPAATMPAATMPAATMGMSSVTASSTFVNIAANASSAVMVRNGGGATTYTTSPNRKEITVSPASGMIGANGSANLTINVNRAGLAAGNYGGSVVVNTGNGSVTVLVSFSVA